MALGLISTARWSYWSRKLTLGALAIAIGTITANKVAFVAIVKGDSMSPTLNPINKKRCDIVLVSRRSINGLEKGDIIAFESPKHPGTFMVKRIIGVGGNLIEELVDEMNSTVEIQPIEPNCYWVAGDSQSSVKSVEIGQVHRSHVLGKVSMIIWPPSRWKMM
ncbi:hypothetical protein ACOME3_009421 [Neoechinorhynchus agilis]